MLTSVITSLKSTTPVNRGSNSSMALFDHSMTAHHTCPCCSYALLRHIGTKGLYWRCSHCYEEMPAWL